MRHLLKISIIFLFYYNGTAQNSVCFKDTLNTPASLVSSGIGMISADFNKDGNTDLAWITPNTSSSFITVALSTGDGKFTKKNYSTGSADAYDIAIGYFNQDNSVDIAISNPTAHNISILLNNTTIGNGTFLAATQVSTGTKYPGKLTAGELINNGGNELIFADFPGTGTYVTVLKNTNYGTFSSIGGFTAGAPVTDIYFTNLPGTSYPDIVVTKQVSSGSNLIIANGDGAGFFTKTDLTVDGYPTGIYALDINADAKVDIVTANSSSKTISVLLASSTGFSTSTPTNYNIGNSPTNLTIRDFTGDGKPDIATCNGPDDNVSILPGTGTGVFGEAIHFTVADNPLAIVFGEFNKDGSNDLAVANYDSNNISVLLNQKCTLTSLDNSINNTFKIYPNPSKGNLTISQDSNKIFSIELYNILGEIIINEKYGDPEIILSNLNAGLYFLFIHSEEGLIKEKIIIE